MSSVIIKRKLLISKTDYKPKRLGLIYNPPSIGIILYNIYSNRISCSFNKQIVSP